MMKKLWVVLFLMGHLVSSGYAGDKFVIDKVHKIVVKKDSNNRRPNSRKIQKRLRRLELAVQQIQQAIFELQEEPDEQPGFICTLKAPYSGASFLSDVYPTKLEAKNQVYQRCLKDHRTGHRSITGSVCDNAYMVKYECSKATF